MSKSAPKTKSTEILLQLIEQNHGEIGQYLKGLLKKDVGKWQRRVVLLLARSKAYKNNDVTKLIELANDIKEVHAAQIQFIEKYIGDLFAPIAINSLQMEREETDFLEREIIPFLTRKTKKNSSQ